MADSMQLGEDANIVHINPYDSRKEIREFYENDNIDPTHYYTTEFVYDEKLIKAFPTFLFYQDGEMVKFLKGWGEHLKWYMAQFMEE